MPTNPSSWERKLEEIYSAALEKDLAARTEFVRRACGEDEHLRREVESLLGYEGKLDGFLETPALELAAAGTGERSLVGRTIGPYTILRLIGGGGMGEVYAARDTRLDRLVALKIISRALAADPELKRRFLREAKAVSALNNPHIVTLHDVGSVDNVDFLVMEYIEGTTLDKLIPSDGLELKRALEYAIDAAEALEQAHGAGVVHRDLKPGNLIISQDGVLKVLDFGLAKLMPRRDSPDSTTLTEKLSVLGTPDYMSPEQAQGNPVDTRSDIFSFGVVLYEMLTGHRPFTGNSSHSTIANILERDARALTELKPGIPRELDRIVLRCLRKDPARRLQCIGDLRAELQDLKEGLESGRPLRAEGPVRRRALQVYGLLVIGVLLSAGGLWLWSRRAEKPDPGRALTRLTWNGASVDPSISADGKLLAFAAVSGNKPDIWVQQIGGAEALRVTNDPVGAFKPWLSPDGTKLLYESAHAGGEIYETPALRSEPRFITKGYCPQYAAESTQVVFLRSSDRSLATVPVSGGASVSLGESFAVDSWAANMYGWCGFTVAPDGKRVLVRGHRQGHEADRSRWWMVSLSHATWQEVDPRRRAASDKYSPFLETWTRIGNNPGKEWIIFGRWTSSWFYDFEGSAAGENRDLYRAILAADGRITSEPERLTFAPGSAAGARVSESGKMVFHNQQWRATLMSIPLDGSSGSRGIAAQDLFRLESTWGMAPSISRDGSKVAYWHGRRVAVRDLKTGHERRLTPELQPMPATGPIISPDGKLVAYYAPSDMANVVDLYVVSIEDGATRKIGKHLGQPKGFSSDGSSIITQLRSASANQLAVVDLLDGDVKAVLKDPKHDLWNGFYSWDDKWITFLKQLDAFRFCVYITPAENGVPAAENRWIPLTSGEYSDNKPQLSPDGNTVYFTSNRDGSHCIWAQRLHPRTKHPVGPPFAIRHLHEHISVMSPEISVATRMILTAVSDIRSDIWMMDLASSN